MATLSKAINKNLFDSILPSFGNPRVHIPVWDDSQKMFICDEFESNGGHRYYRGIRFCDRIVIRICAPVEQIAAQASELINGCYKSFLDPDFNTRLTQILPKLEQK